MRSAIFQTVPFRPEKLPGPVALWGFEERTGTNVANEFADKNPGQNLVAYRNGYFSTWSPLNSAVATDSAVAGPDGVSGSASTLSLAANAASLIRTITSYAAGTYTVSLWVRTSDGTAQTCRLAYYTGSFVYSSDIAISGTWQKISFTFTSAVTVTSVVIANSTAAVAQVLHIYDYQCVAGSSVSPANKPIGGLTAKSNAPFSWSASGAALNGTSQDIIATFDKPVSLPNFTAYFAFRRAATSDTGIIAIASALPSYLNFTFAASYGQNASQGYPRVACGGGSNVVEASMCSFRNGRSYAVAIVRDANGIGIYVDGTEMARGPNTGTASFNALAFGTISGGYYSDSTYGCAALYESAHTADQIRAMTGYMQKRVQARTPATFGASNIFVGVEGDSISFGQQSGVTGMAWATGALRNLEPAQGRNYAAGGSHIRGTGNTIEARLPIVAASLWPGVRKRIMHVACGTNDLGGGTTDVQVIADLKWVCQQFKAMGFYVIIATILPRATINTARAVVNTEIRNAANIGVYWDLVEDRASDATIGVDGAEANTSYYGDGVHPTGYTSAILTTYAQNAFATAVAAVS